MIRDRQFRLPHSARNIKWEKKIRRRKHKTKQDKANEKPRRSFPSDSHETVLNDIQKINSKQKNRLRTVSMHYMCIFCR